VVAVVVAAGKETETETETETMLAPCLGFLFVTYQPSAHFLEEMHVTTMTSEEADIVADV
jgi:hypothetical protein